MAISRRQAVAGPDRTVRRTNPNAGGPRTEAAARTLANAGASGNKTATGTNAPWVAQLIAIRRPPVEPTTPPTRSAPIRPTLPVGSRSACTGTANADVIDSYVDANGNLNNASDLVRTINCVQPGHLYAGTDLATPMDFAWKYLRDHARAGVKTGIIFETDGTPQTSNYTCAQATAAANAAKASGVEVFTIGFSLEAGGGGGAPVCPDQTRRTALTQLASMATNSSSTNTTRCDPNENTDGDHFFCQPSGADLTAVFKTAAEQLAGLKSHLIAPYPLPQVASVSPNAGPPGGGTSIIISGTNFTGATAVKVGGGNASIHRAERQFDPRHGSCGTSGQASAVTVTTPGGTSPTHTGDSADRFTYN